jgi:ferric iron reductase protein FhuF
LGETLVCTSSPPDEAIPVARLLHEAALIDDCLLRHARRLGMTGADLHATASSWCFAYLDALLPPMIAAASVLQHASLQLTGDAPPIACDRNHLLHAPLWHGGQPNPMHRPQRSVIRIHGDMPLTLHRQCGLFHLLPGQDYCGACPLAPQFQQARCKLSAAASSS